MNRFILYLILLLLALKPVQAQLKADSLLKLLPPAKEDTNAVWLYIQIGEEYENNETAKAKYYFSKAQELSRKLKYNRGIFRCYSRYSYALGVEGSLDSCLLVNQLALELARKMGDSITIAKAVFNVGTSYNMLNDLENAAKYYEEGKNIFGNLGNEEFESTGNDMLQLLYHDLKQYKRAIEFGEKAVAAIRKQNDPPGLGRALSNLGLSYEKLGQYQKAKALYEESLQLAIQSGDKKLQANDYLNLGSLEMKLNKFVDMDPTSDEKALALARDIGSPEEEINALEGLLYYYTAKGNYKKAQQLGQQALDISYQFKLRKERGDVFSQLSNLAYAMHNADKGEYYAEQYNLISDSLVNENIQKNILDIEKKYESAKKNAVIKQLEAEQQVQKLSITRKNTLNYLLIGSAAALLIISFLSYRSFQHKKKLQEQRIIELETQQQLLATEAVLKGEEQERTRLAKDLHDGLGGMLAGIKHSFNNMKENLIMTPENKQSFDRGIDMLDNSIKEMRRVAHNMMPEALLRYGLEKTLRDYIAEINQSGIVEIVYESMGMENKQIDNSTSIAIYRIVQELITNVVKHASARQVLVQLLSQGDKLVVTVEDDGKGFDTSTLNLSKPGNDQTSQSGIGWKNIQSRVEFLKGKLEVSSEQEKGTTVNMEFTI